MTDDRREVLSHGFGALTEDQKKDRLAQEIRINPIGEGDISTGDSGVPTYWDADTLRQAVEAGAFDGAEIVKGRGGTDPHFPLDEHVPPENKLGRVDEWEYQEGVGPVGYAEIVGEEIAEQIQLGLLDVSADMFRVLGDEDEELGAHRVEEILAVPRITILDHGASHSAFIEPVQAEALGLNPDAFEVVDDDVSDKQENILRQMWHGLSEYFGTDVSDSNEVYNDANRLTHYEDTSEGGDEIKAESNEVNDSNMTEEKIEELRSKLREREDKVSDLENEVEELNESVESLEDDMSEKEEKLEEANEALESKDEEIEQLQEHVTPMKELMAEIVAADSELLTAETVASKYDLPELVDLLSASDGDDEELSYTEKVKEQLSQSVNPRGDAEPEPDMTDEEIEQLEDMAFSALTARDLREADMSELSAAEYVQDRLGVDVSEAKNERDLRQRVMAAKAGE